MRTGFGHFPPPETPVRERERTRQSNLTGGHGGHVHEYNPHLHSSFWPTPQEAAQNPQTNKGQSVMNLKHYRTNTNTIGTNDHDFHGFSGRSSTKAPARPGGGYRLDGHGGSTPSGGGRQSGTRNFQSLNPSPGGYGNRGSSNYANQNNPYSVAGYIKKSFEAREPQKIDDSWTVVKSRNNGVNTSSFQQSNSGGIGGTKAAAPAAGNKFGYYSALSRFRETNVF